MCGIAAERRACLWGMAEWPSAASSDSETMLLGRKVVVSGRHETHLQACAVRYPPHSILSACVWGNIKGGKAQGF